MWLLVPVNTHDTQSSTLSMVQYSLPIGVSLNLRLGTCSPIETRKHERDYLHG